MRKLEDSSKAKVRELASII
ncbi:hypothetical protein A2U01_0093570, partial [Trifolium medium]|nr:hypothetical protein [Trifolium medium]